MAPSTKPETTPPKNTLVDFIREKVTEFVLDRFQNDYTITCNDTNNTPEDMANGVINVTIAIPISRLGWELCEPDAETAEE